MHDKGHLLHQFEILDGHDIRRQNAVLPGGVYDGTVCTLQGNNMAWAAYKYRDCSILARKTAVRKDLSYRSPQGYKRDARGSGEPSYLDRSSFAGMRARSSGPDGRSSVRKIMYDVFQRFVGMVPRRRVVSTML